MQLYYYPCEKLSPVDLLPFSVLHFQLENPHISFIQVFIDGDLRKMIEVIAKIFEKFSFFSVGTLQPACRIQLTPKLDADPGNEMP